MFRSDSKAVDIRWQCYDMKTLTCVRLSLHCRWVFIKATPYYATPVKWFQLKSTDISIGELEKATGRGPALRVNRITQSAAKMCAVITMRQHAPKTQTTQHVSYVRLLRPSCHYSSGTAGFRKCIVANASLPCYRLLLPARRCVGRTGQIVLLDAEGLQRWKVPTRGDAACNSTRVTSGALSALQASSSTCAYSLKEVRVIDLARLRACSW